MGAAPQAAGIAVTRHDRLRRSQLVTPAKTFRMIEKGAPLDADSLILDLEDAVAPNV